MESEFFPRETQPDLMGVKSLIKVEIQGIKGDIKPCWTFLLLLTCPTRQINHDIDVKLQNTDRQNKYLFIFHGWMLDLLGYPVHQLPGPSCPAPR